jgi:hypothetical protein
VSGVRVRAVEHATSLNDAACSGTSAVPLAPPFDLALTEITSDVRATVTVIATTTDHAAVGIAPDTDAGATRLKDAEMMVGAGKLAATTSDAVVGLIVVDHARDIIV